MLRAAIHVPVFDREGVAICSSVTTHDAALLHDTACPLYGHQTSGNLQQRIAVRDDLTGPLPGHDTSTS
jgi:hypothetical protein